MSQVTVTFTTTTPPVTVVCSRPTLITTMVMLAPTFVGLMTSNHHDVVLLSLFIVRDRMGSSAGHITMPKQQQPKYQMSSQAYTNYLWVFHR